MRAWKALGVVETIYEEELFQDSNSSSSSFLSPSHSSPPSPLHSTIQSWSQVTGRKPDVLIHVQGSCFHLHKDPLTSRSIYLRHHLTSEPELILSPPLNITAQTFALVVDFCYGAHILITPLNIAALRTAAELLDMSEEHNGFNLCHVTESYFRRTVCVNKEHASTVLRTCFGLLPEAETTAFLVSRCVEVLGFAGDGHGVSGLFADVKTVRPEVFCAVMQSMSRRFSRHDLLYWIVDYYLKEHEVELRDEQMKTRICNSIDCNKLSQQLLIHAVQNPTLPLRFLVQAMLVEQLNTRHSIFSASNHRVVHRHRVDHDPITLGAILQRDAALRQVAQLKAEMETTTSRIQSLEKELSDMKELCLSHESDKNKRNSTRNILESGRSASFHYGTGTTSDSKIKGGERECAGSASCRFSERRETAGGSSSSLSPRVDKNIRQRLIEGFKSAFRASKTGLKHGSDGKDPSKVRGDGSSTEKDSEDIVVIEGNNRRSQSLVM